MSQKSNDPNKIKAKLSFVSSERTLCKKCHKQRLGKLFIDKKTKVRDMNGKWAYPYIWFCDACGKQRKPGWTGPVDLRRELPPNLDEDCPDFDASDDTWLEYYYDRAASNPNKTLQDMGFTM